MAQTEVDISTEFKKSIVEKVAYSYQRLRHGNSSSQIENISIASEVLPGDTILVKRVSRIDQVPDQSSFNTAQPDRVY